MAKHNVTVDTTSAPKRSKASGSSDVPPACPFMEYDEDDERSLWSHDFNWDGNHPTKLYFGCVAAHQVMMFENTIGEISQNLFYTTDRALTMSRVICEQWDDARTVKMHVYKSMVCFKVIKDVRQKSYGDRVGALVAEELLVSTKPVRVSHSPNKFYLIMAPTDF